MEEEEEVGDGARKRFVCVRDENQALNFNSVVNFSKPRRFRRFEIIEISFRAYLLLCERREGLFLR